MGNRTQIRKERKGLVQERGCYTFAYDVLNRLTAVEKDGQALREYAYDSFGNRTGMEDYGHGTRTAYRYDALNRLLEEEMEGGSRSYTYDLRGNLTAEYQNGSLIHGYEYNAMNRLAKSWDGTGRESIYHYNGLGQRTGKEVNGIREDYLLDLTKPYHNLLEYRKGDLKQNFYWDSTIAAMEEAGRSPRYYLNDELGSPLRVLYGTGKGDVYGYDEFGNDLSEVMEKSEFGIAYSRQGEGQPFGYTGYRYDEISGTYFAQAREYKAGIGRFAAEDVIRGNGAVPKTLNRYGYCWNNSLYFVDLNGEETIIVTGGNYNHMNYNQNGGYKFNFVETSIREIIEIRVDNPDENITWIVADEGYNFRDKALMNDVADNFNVDIRYIKETNQLIDYVNNKTERKFMGFDMGEKRDDDKITRMSFYSHGMYTGTIDLAYKYTSDLMITSSMVSEFDADAFDNLYTFFGCCNTGTKQENERDSFAQLWVNHLGGTAIAANGKTDYKKMNIGEKSLLYYVCAANRKIGLFSPLGALNAPVPDKDASWIFFGSSCE